MTLSSCYKYDFFISDIVTDVSGGLIPTVSSAFELEQQNPRCLGGIGVYSSVAL